MKNYFFPSWRPLFLLLCGVLAVCFLPAQTCPGNLLTNPDFQGQNISGWEGAGIYAENQTNGRYISVCTNGTAAYQTKPAIAGKNYNLSVRAYKSFAGTSGVVRLKFLSNTWQVLSEQFGAVSSLTYSLASLQKTAPAGTAYVEVGLIKDAGAGCVNADDWCLTETGSNNPLPDLTISNLNIPVQSVQAGQVFSYRFDLANIAATDIIGNFNIKAYLSTDDILSANDIQDGIVPTGNLIGFQNIPQVLGATTVPANLAPGNYFLILKVDADNQIAESNENNNVLSAVSSIQITAPGGGTGTACDKLIGNGTLACVQKVSNSPNFQVVFDANGQRTRQTYDPSGALLNTENLGVSNPPVAKLQIVSGDTLKKINADGSVAFAKPFPAALLNSVGSFAEAIELGGGYLFLGFVPQTGNPAYARDSLVGIKTDQNLNILAKKTLLFGGGIPGGSYAYNLTAVNSNRVVFWFVSGSTPFSSLKLILMDDNLVIRNQKTYFSGVFSAGGSITPNICRGYTVTDNAALFFCKSGACFVSETADVEFVGDSIRPYSSIYASEISSLGNGTRTLRWTSETSDGGMLLANRTITGQLSGIQNDTITFQKYNAAGALLFTKKVNVPDASSVIKVYELNGQIYLFKRLPNSNLTLSRLDCYEAPPPPSGCAANLLQNGGFENNGDNWEGVVVIATTASAGTKAAKVCPNTILRQTIASTVGKNLSMLFKARSESSAGSVLAYIKYLSSSWQPLVTEFFSFSTTATYASGTFSKTAPAGTAWVEVGFLGQSTNCTLVDEICLSGGGTQPSVSFNNCPTVPITVTVAQGATSAIVNYPTLTATAVNCPNSPSIVLVSPANTASGSAFPIGTTTVSWRATLSGACSGPEAFCTFYIIVQPGDTNICAGNLLQNPNFEAQNISGWSGAGIYAENVPNGRYISVCTNGTAAYQTKPAIAGKTYNLSVRAFKSFAGTTGVVGLKFLSNNWQVLQSDYFGVNSLTYAVVSTSKTAPAGTAWVEVSLVKDGGAGCINADDWCLTQSPMAINQPNWDATRLVSGDPNAHAPLDSVEIADFALFPNPAEAAVSIDLSQWQGKAAHLTFVNQLGQTVFEKHYEKVENELETVDLGAIFNGLYFVKMETTGQRAVVKRLMVINAF